MRGGASYTFLPPDGPPNWPRDDGCIVKTVKSIKLLPGTYLDRIGAKTGKFVAAVQKRLDGVGKPASFSSRSLRTLGETPYRARPEDQDFREVMYKIIYNTENDPANRLYYVIKVVEEIVGLFPCIANKAFGYNGGALQLGLTETIAELERKGKIRILNPAETLTLFGGINFPPYTDPTDGIKAAFRAYSPSLSALVERYYSTHAEREAYRLSVGSTVPTTPAPDPAEGRRLLELMSTVLPKTPIAASASFSSPAPSAASGTTAPPSAIPFAGFTSP